MAPSLDIPIQSIGSTKLICLHLTPSCLSSGLVYHTQIPIICTNFLTKSAMHCLDDKASFKYKCFKAINL